MRKYLTVPFILECVMFPDGEDISYVIVRDPDNRVSCVAPNLDYAMSHLEEVLDELVFLKNKDNNKDEN